MEDLLFCAPAFSTKSRFSTLLTVTDADGDPMELWELDATGIICDDELSPAQMKNLQDELDAKVMDRTLVILDIFAARAPINSGLPLQAVPKPNGFAAPCRQIRTPKPMHWNRVAINQIAARIQTERCCGHFPCRLPAEQMARFPFNSP